MDMIIYIIPILGLSALIYSYFKHVWISKQSSGTEKMIRISQYIREGAIAFLKTEYKVLIWFIIIVSILLGYANTGSSDSSWLISLSFVIGAFCSALAGFLGMIAATNANVRTTEGARKGLGPALEIAFSNNGLTRK